MRNPSRMTSLVYCVLLLSVSTMALGQTTHYAVNDDGEHLLAYQISDLACNFRVFPTGINSGVAVMALGQAVTIQVSLLDVAGILIASAVVELSALGQDARNINDYEWDVKGIDFSNIQGSVVLSGTEEFAAIVILVRPDQFATLPVGKQLAAMPDLNQVQ